MGCNCNDKKPDGEQTEDAKSIALSQLSDDGDIEKRNHILAISKALELRREAKEHENAAAELSNTANMLIASAMPHFQYSTIRDENGSFTKYDRSCERIDMTTLKLEVAKKLGVAETNRIWDMATTNKGVEAVSYRYVAIKKSGS